MPENKPIRLIVGLGNPGAQYEHTRHNMGFDLLDALAEQCGVRFSQSSRFAGQTARVTLGESEVWLLKPSTYMNLSGSAVQPLAAYFKITPEEILVVHDELDIHPGCLKAKLGGGNAGHNGLKDITARLGTPQFWRLRIGIGHPRIFCPQQQVYDWVLGIPSEEHEKLICDSREAALKSLKAFAAGDFERVQRLLRKWGNPPKPAKVESEEKTPEAQA